MTHIHQTTYVPTSYDSRLALALELMSTLRSHGFQLRESHLDEEEVWTKNVSGFKVVVYTTVDRLTQTTRKVGKDAIRVCATYQTKDGETRGVTKESRVNRTGTIEAIISRMVSRIELVTRKLDTVERNACHCGAPKFVSKNDNLVCAELCWTKKDTSIPKLSATDRVRRLADHCRAGFTLIKGAVVMEVTNNRDAKEWMLKQDLKIAGDKFQFCDIGADGLFVIFGGKKQGSKFCVVSRHID